MKRIIRLTESDLTRIVKRVIKESEEEYVDLETFGDNKNTIEFDFRRERVKERKVRRLVSEDPKFEKLVSNKYQTFKDIVYGYDRFNEKIVKARQEGRFGKDLGLNDLVMYYNCNDDVIKYAEVSRPINIQEQSDKDWLGAWCSKINWNSRVGKKKGLFRK
jgi:hypothetical protein